MLRRARWDPLQLHGGAIRERLDQMEEIKEHTCCVTNPGKYRLASGLLQLAANIRTASCSYADADADAEPSQ